MKRGSSRRLMLAPSSLAVAMIALSLLRRHLLGGVLNGLDDIVVARAAAEIAVELVPDLFLRRLGIALEELRRRHDHARRAEAALQPVLLPEGVLDRVQLAVLGHAFDRGDLRAVGLDGQHGAGLHGLAIQMDGAGPALAGVAAHVRAREPGQLADEVHEQEPGLDVMRVSDAIDGHGRFHCAYLLRGLRVDDCRLVVEGSEAGKALKPYSWGLGMSRPRTTSKFRLPRTKSYIRSHGYPFRAEGGARDTTEPAGVGGGAARTVRGRHARRERGTAGRGRR